MEAKTAKLLSQEGDIFYVNYDVVLLSQFIKTTLEDDDSQIPEMPLPNVKSSVLRTVLKFCEHYMEDPMHEIPKPIPWPKRVSDCVQEWYAKFVLLLPYQHLFEVILAANYLHISPLLEICCARLARLLLNKTPNQIKAMFQFDDSFNIGLFESLMERNHWSTEAASEEDMVAEPEDLIERLRNLEC